MALRTSVGQIFAPTGPLSQALQEHKVRSGQVEMAQAVAQTIEEGGLLVVEAGTGVGKTFAYLVPALLSGERVLVSTATKALQDQLFQRDIPFLKSVLNVPVHTALLKGRSSYLCLHRLEFARTDERLDDVAAQQLARVEMWALSTRSGDLAELDGLDDSATLIPAITSTRENCLGSRCPQASQCHVNLARREAMAADVVVVNHHLFFADLNVRESGVAELLPTVRCVVFDEAHQLNETGVQFLGKQFGSGQLSSFAADVVKVTHDQARGFADWHGLAHDLGNCAHALLHYCATRKLAGKVEWHSIAAASAWQQLLQQCSSTLHAVAQALATVAQTSPDLQTLQARCEDLLALVGSFCVPASEGFVRWLDTGTQVRMVESPLDIASAMRERVVGQGGSDSLKSWVFTSATLGHDPELSWFVQSCGLEHARVLKVQSPFDYPTQASLFIPPGMPKPADPAHSAAVADLVAAGAMVLGGRTMVLTTTLRAMRAIGAQLIAACAHPGDLEVLVQGHMPKRELLARFCADRNSVGKSGSAKGCILVASVSFWEGIDIPGDALQLLVIDKLPFSPPDDPVQKARAASLEAQGKSPFKLLHLPQAAIALKQGAGRLIRRESDRGVLVVCDVRLAQMGYGKQLLAGLPPMARLADQAALMDRLAELTKPSTMDRYWGVPPESAIPTADS
jgi:ATP-dependent DNA helicase DinG